MTIVRLTRGFCVAALRHARIISGSFVRVRSGYPYYVNAKVTDTSHDCDAVGHIMKAAIEDVTFDALTNVIVHNTGSNVIPQNTYLEEDEFLRQCRLELDWGVSPLLVLSRAQEGVWTYRTRSLPRAEVARQVAKTTKLFAESALPGFFDVDIMDHEPRKAEGLIVVG